MERNPLQAAARNEVERVEAARLAATTRPNPALTVEGEGYPLFESDRPSFFDDQELTIRYDQELEISGRRALRTQVADTAVEVAGAGADDRRRRLLLTVRSTYFQAVLARENVEEATAALDEIDEVIRLSAIRRDAGKISGAELLRLRVERLTFGDDTFAAELADRDARSALLALLNVPNLTQPFEAVEPLVPSPAQFARIDRLIAQSLGRRDLERLQSQALSHRPDLAASRLERERATTETRLQRALRTPNVTVGGGYRRDFGANAVVFGVTLPLPLFDRNLGGMARADAELRRAENLAAATEMEVRLDLQYAVNAVDVNRARVRYIEEEYLGTARQSREIVLASYELGAGTLMDFLDAQRAYRVTQQTSNRRCTTSGSVCFDWRRHSVYRWS